MCIREIIIIHSKVASIREVSCAAAAAAAAIVAHELTRTLNDAAMPLAFFAKGSDTANRVDNITHKHTHTHARTHTVFSHFDVSVLFACVVVGLCELA